MHWSGRRGTARSATYLTLAVVTLTTWLAAAHRAAALVSEVEVGTSDPGGAASGVPAALPLALVAVMIVARSVATAAARRGQG